MPKNKKIKGSSSNKKSRPCPHGRVKKPRTISILGIDPGVATTGYGIIKKRGRRLTAIHYGNITTSKNLVFGKRLIQIYRELKKIIKEHQPDKIAVEQIFFFKNKKTAINVGQARGIILLAIAQSKILLFEPTPLQVKQTLTAYGHASKKEVEVEVKKILNLRKPPKSDDTIDALAIAIWCDRKTN